MKRDGYHVQLANVKGLLDAVVFAKGIGCRRFMGAGCAKSAKDTGYCPEVRFEQGIKEFLKQMEKK